MLYSSRFLVMVLLYTAFLKKSILYEFGENSQNHISFFRKKQKVGRFEQKEIF